MLYWRDLAKAFLNPQFERLNSRYTLRPLTEGLVNNYHCFSNDHNPESRSTNNDVQVVLWFYQSIICSIKSCIDTTTAPAKIEYQ